MRKNEKGGSLALEHVEFRCFGSLEIECFFSPQRVFFGKCSSVRTYKRVRRLHVCLYTQLQPLAEGITKTHSLPSRLERITILEIVKKKSPISPITL